MQAEVGSYEVAGARGSQFQSLVQFTIDVWISSDGILLTVES